MTLFRVDLILKSIIINPDQSIIYANPAKIREIRNNSQKFVKIREIRKALHLEEKNCIYLKRGLPPVLSVYKKTSKCLTMT